MPSSVIEPGWAKLVDELITPGFSSLIQESRESDELEQTGTEQQQEPDIEQ